MQGDNGANSAKWKSRGKGKGARGRDRRFSAVFCSVGGSLHYFIRMNYSYASLTRYA